MLDLSAKPEERDNDLIPNNQLAWAYIHVRSIKTSPDTGTRYLDVELTVADNQPYAKRKLWVNIMDPLFPQNSDGAKNMGLMMLKRIMETCMGATPDNPASYQQLAEYRDLTGKCVPIRISVKKEKDERYDDKNEVEFLSPFSTVKSVVKAYNALVHEKVYNLSALKKDAQAGAQQPMAGHAPAQAPQPATTGFGAQQPPVNTAPSQPAAAPTGFGGVPPQGQPVQTAKPPASGNPVLDDEIPF